MISPHVKRYLTEHLQGQRSADESREILHLIDEGLTAGGALVAEFDSTLDAVSKKIPGLAIDFDKLLSSDEIECDPLISQGNLALLRLDAIYYQAFEAWKKSGGDLHRFRRITKAEDPAKYSDRTEKHERTDENYPPDAQLLNQVVNITLSAFRVQATITHRKDQLKQAKESDQSVSRDATRSASPPQQTNSSQSDGWRGRTAPAEAPDQADVISADESLTDFDDLSAPIEGYMPLLIRGVNKIGILKAYSQFEPLTKTQPAAQQAPTKGSAATVAFRSAKECIATDNAVASSPNCDGTPCSDCGTPQSEHAEATNNLPQDSREEELVIEAIVSPTRKRGNAAPSSVASAVRTEIDTANNVSQRSREEEPVICELSAIPRETNTFTHNQPLYHKRE